MRFFFLCGVLWCVVLTNVQIVPVEVTANSLDTVENSEYFSQISYLDTPDEFREISKEDLYCEVVDTIELETNYTPCPDGVCPIVVKPTILPTLPTLPVVPTLPNKTNACVDCNSFNDAATTQAGAVRQGFMGRLRSFFGRFRLGFRFRR